MALRQLALSDNELFLKKLYMNDNREYLKSPMSFEQYKKLIANEDKMTESVDRFSRFSKGKLGITVVEVEEISQGDEIVVFINERYSYPVMHNHAYIEMLYVYSGSFTHFVENQELTMNAGDFCILAPKAMHALSIASDEAIVFNILISRNVFDSAFLKLLKGGQLLIDFFENVLFDKRVSPYVIYPTKNDPWLQEIIFTMLEEYDTQSYAYNTSLELYTKLLFIHIIRHYEMFAIISDSIDNTMDDKIVAILGYISVNYTHTSLKDLASFFNYTESYVSRMIKKYTGKTFVTLITELQMRYAKELLEKSDLSITEISQMVGCFDASHMNKKFKKIYGVSPNDFRNSLSTIHK